MYHSAIGNIRANLLTIQTTDNPVAIKVSCNRIKQAADEMIEVAEEMEERQKADADLRTGP